MSTHRASSAPAQAQTAPEMVERVAHAISLSFREEGYSPEFDEPSVWDEFVRAARLAITAMREPTEAMLDAPDMMAWTLEIWQAMIDAALGEAR